MNRLLVHAAAFACAVVLTALFYLLLAPMWVEAGTIFGSLVIVGLGLCAARRNIVALIPAALAAAGLMLIGLSLPAAAASTPAHKVLGVVEAPVQPLALAAPIPPQQVVVSIAQPDANSVAVPVASGCRMRAHSSRPCSSAFSPSSCASCRHRSCGW